MTTDNKSEQEIKTKASLENLLNESKTDLEKQNPVINSYQELGIKYTFLLNGASAVAVTTMFTTIFIQRPELAHDVLTSISIFAIGAFVSASSIISAYWSNIFSRDSHSISVNFFTELLTLFEDTKNKDFFSNAKSLISKIHKTRKKRNILSILTNILMIISLIFFLFGIFKAAAPFYLNTSPELYKQTAITSDSYQGVSIHPLPLTKPN